MGCEETDLFIRLLQRWPDAQILYEPAAPVRHTVPASRLAWRYFRTRCFAEGQSEAAWQPGSEAVGRLPLGAPTC